MFAPDWYTEGCELVPLDLKAELLNSDIVRGSRWLGRKAMQLYKFAKERLRSSASKEKELGSVATASMVAPATAKPGRHALPVQSLDVHGQADWDALDALNASPVLLPLVASLPTAGSGYRPRHAQETPAISVKYIVAQPAAAR